METQQIQRQAGTEDDVFPVPYNGIRAEDADRSVLGCPPPTLKSTLQNPPASCPPQVQAGVHEEASGVELIGGGFFVDGLLAQVVAAFVLFLHAVHQQQDQENGKEDAHSAAHNQSWRGKGQQGENGSSGLRVPSHVYSWFSYDETSSPSHRLSPAC